MSATGNELSTTERLVLQRAFEHWRELDEHIRWCDQQVGLHLAGSFEPGWLAAAIIAFRKVKLIVNIVYG